MSLYVKLSNVLTKLAGVSTPVGTIVKNSSNTLVSQTNFIDTKADIDSTALGDNLKTVIPSAYAVKELNTALTNVKTTADNAQPLQTKFKMEQYTLDTTNPIKIRFGRYSSLIMIGCLANEGTALISITTSAGTVYKKNLLTGSTWTPSNYTVTFDGTYLNITTTVTSSSSTIGLLYLIY